MKLADFEALSFDCYGTLIDWEAGIAAVLNPWATRRGLSLDDEQLLTAYSAHEATAEVEHPADLYPDILARSVRALGAELGVEVSGDDAGPGELGAGLAGVRGLPRRAERARQALPADHPV